MAEKALQPEDEQAVRIVRAFAARARSQGIRAIVMDEIVRELGISKKTLYKHFASKTDLVRALIERWERRLTDPGDPISNPREGTALGAIRKWVASWYRNDAQYSPAFWTELKRDYPDIYGIYQQALAARMRPLADMLAPYLRPGVSMEFATEMYFGVVRLTRDPGRCERMGMTREEAMIAAIEMWAQGVLTDPDAPVTPTRAKKSRTLKTVR